MDLWWGIWTAFRPREGEIWTKFSKNSNARRVAPEGCWSFDLTGTLVKQSFSQRPIDSTSNGLQSVICIHAQIQFVNELYRLFSLEQMRFLRTVFINYIFLLIKRLCLRKSGIANFTVLNLNVNQPLDFRTVGTAILTRNFQYFCLHFQHYCTYWNTCCLPIK